MYLFLCYAVNYGEKGSYQIISLLPCYNPDSWHSNNNLATVNISLHADQTEGLAFFFVRRDKYLDLVKCLMKHEEAFPFKLDLLEQVMTSIAVWASRL